MKKSNGDIEIKNSNFDLFLAGLAFFFASMIVSFWAAGYHHRTKTPPLVNLTLSQPACEHLAQSGIPAEVKNGICIITARYREINFENNGYIEVAGKPPLKISEGLIVAIVQLNDGSDEPWSIEHQKAFAYLIGSMMLLLISVWVVLQAAKHRIRK